MFTWEESLPREIVQDIGKEGNKRRWLKQKDGIDTERVVPSGIKGEGENLEFFRVENWSHLSVDNSSRYHQWEICEFPYRYYVLEVWLWSQEDDLGGIVFIDPNTKCTCKYQS